MNADATVAADHVINPKINKVFLDNLVARIATKSVDVEFKKP